ncbi:MAG: DNA-binding protein [Sulfuricaulis sp.]
MPTAPASEASTAPSPLRSTATGDQTRVLLRQAALELLREGIRPKVLTVRARAGGRGSASTIADVLNELWVEVGGWAAAELTGEAPLWLGSVPPALINAAHRLWEVALTEAAAGHHKDLADMQQREREANDRVRAADQARLEAEMRCDALRRENRRLEELGERLKNQVDDEIVQRRRLEAKNDRLTEQLRALVGRKLAARKPVRRVARGLRQSLRQGPRPTRISKKSRKKLRSRGRKRLGRRKK